MTWYDVDDVLYDGDKEEIEKILCPDCGAKIGYRYSDDPRGFEVTCKQCGYLSRSYGGPIPNCVKYYGNEYEWK